MLTCSSPTPTHCRPPLAKSPDRISSLGEICCETIPSLSLTLYIFRSGVEGLRLMSVRLLSYICKSSRFAHVRGRSGLQGSGVPSDWLILTGFVRWNEKCDMAAVRDLSKSGKDGAVSPIIVLSSLMAILKDQVDQMKQIGVAAIGIFEEATNGKSEIVVKWGSMVYRTTTARNICTFVTFAILFSVFRSFSSLCLTRDYIALSL